MGEVRDAQLGDVPAIRPQLLQMGYTDEELGDVEGRLPQVVSSPANRLLVAVDGADVVGLAGLVVSQSIQQPGRSCLLSVIVTREDRRRQGIGATLMAASETAARDAGCCRIELTTLHDNHGAHALFRQAGSVETGLRFKKTF